MSGLIDVMNAAANQIRSVTATIMDMQVQVEPQMVLNPTPPTVDIYPGDPARDADSAAYDDIDGAYLLTVRARVNTADQDAGQNLLLSFMDDENDLCLGVALVDEPTLNGTCGSIHIRDVSGYRLYEHPSGDGAYLGFQFTLVALYAKS